MLYNYKAEVEGDWHCGADHPEYGKSLPRTIEGMIEVRGSHPKFSHRDRILTYLENMHGESRVDQLKAIPVPVI